MSADNLAGHAIVTASYRLHLLAALLSFFAGLAMAGEAKAQLDCEPTGRQHAYPVSGEAYGGHNFVFDAAPGYRLALHRALWGWRIAVLDEAGTDMIPHSTMRGGLPEPRDLYGWHFRNSDNTAPNTGDVNAPKLERRFTYLPSGDGQTTTGLGWLVIDDFALSNLEPGGQARMMYLRFDACLMQPKTDAEIAAEADFISLEYLPEEEELMRGCGLGEEFTLDTLIAPRMVNGDFDGDGALDHAAYVLRTSDGARGPAICRAGTWLHLPGMDGAVADSSSDSGFFRSVERWEVSTIDQVMTGWEGEAPRPAPSGDVLVLERIDKEMHSLYWDGEAFRSHQHYRYVEP